MSLFLNHSAHLTREESHSNGTHLWTSEFVPEVDWHDFVPFVAGCGPEVGVVIESVAGKSAVVARLR